MKLDVPEILIVLGVLAGIAWAIYNRLHPHVETTGAAFARRTFTFACASEDSSAIRPPVGCACAHESF